MSLPPPPGPPLNPLHNPVAWAEQQTRQRARDAEAAAAAGLLPTAPWAPSQPSPRTPPVALEDLASVSDPWERLVRAVARLETAKQAKSQAAQQRMVARVSELVPELAHDPEANWTMYFPWDDLALLAWFRARAARGGPSPSLHPIEVEKATRFRGLKSVAGPSTPSWQMSGLTRRAYDDGLADVTLLVYRDGTFAYDSTLLDARGRDTVSGTRYRLANATVARNIAVLLGLEPSSGT